MSLPTRTKINRRIFTQKNFAGEIIGYPAHAIDKLVRETYLDPYTTRFLYHDEEHSMNQDNQQMEKGIRVSDFLDSVMPYIVDRVKKEIE